MNGVRKCKYRVEAITRSETVSCKGQILLSQAFKIR